MNILLSNLNGKYFHYFRSLSERKSRNVIKKLEQLKREFLVYCKQNHFSPIFHSFFLSFFLYCWATYKNKQKKMILLFFPMPFAIHILSFPFEMIRCTNYYLFLLFWVTFNFNHLYRFGNSIRFSYLQFLHWFSGIPIQMRQVDSILATNSMYFVVTVNIRMQNNAYLMLFVNCVVLSHLNLSLPLSLYHCL